MIGIPSNCIDDVWSVAEPLLQKVLDRYETGYSLDDLKARCKTQDMQLWLRPEAAFLTEIQVFPRYKCLHIPYIGGSDMGDWFDQVMEQFEAFARHMGCAYVSGCGRRGWARQGKSRGYEEGFQIVRKQL
jgi:hypothetical protein